VEKYECTLLPVDDLLASFSYVVAGQYIHFPIHCQVNPYYVQCVILFLLHFVILLQSGTD